MRGNTNYRSALVWWEFDAFLDDKHTGNKSCPYGAWGDIFIDDNPPPPRVNTAILLHAGPIFCLRGGCEHRGYYGVVLISKVAHLCHTHKSKGGRLTQLI